MSHASGQLTNAEIAIRPVAVGDWEAVVAIGREVVRDGTTYAFGPDTDDAALMAYWLDSGARTFVACVGDEVVGCYVLRPNQRGRGSHVANGSYMVAAAAGGRGVGRALGVHSIEMARELGYAAIQFNYVVSTNTRAVALWEGLGFAIVGRVPRAFSHATLGLVDVLVMHRFV